MSNALYVLMVRDLRVCARSGAQILTIYFFYILLVSLFPLGVGPDPKFLQKIGPGVLWVSVLLSSLLALGRLWSEDYASNALEELCLSPHPLFVLVLMKTATHWLVSGLPLVILSPMLGLQFAMPADALLIVAASLFLGTLFLSLLGAVGAALTLGLKGEVSMVSILVLPLYIPALIFGSGAVEAQLSGGNAAPHLWLLAALVVLALFFAPLATAAALRIALE